MKLYRNQHLFILYHNQHRSQAGEFVEVSNGSGTDPCAWVGRVAKLLQLQGVGGRAFLVRRAAGLSRLKSIGELPADNCCVI